MNIFLKTHPEIKNCRKIKTTFSKLPNIKAVNSKTTITAAYWNNCKNNNQNKLWVKIKIYLRIFFFFFLNLKLFETLS